MAALFIAEFTEIVVIHCLAHRLELAFRDTMKVCVAALYQKLTTLLLGN